MGLSWGDTNRGSPATVPWPFSGHNCPSPQRHSLCRCVCHQGHPADLRPKANPKLTGFKRLANDVRLSHHLTDSLNPSQPVNHTHSSRIFVHTPSGSYSSLSGQSYCREIISPSVDCFADTPNDYFILPYKKPAVTHRQLLLYLFVCLSCPSHSLCPDSYRVFSMLPQDCFNTACWIRPHSHQLVTRCPGPHSQRLNTS